MKRKFVSLISLVLAAFALLALAGCHTSSVTADEDVVVIRASAEQDGMTLLAVMEELQEEGELSFTVSDGMITELNGTKQTPSSYWMLYTSDRRTPTSSGVPANMRAKCWARPRWARGNSP